MINVRAAISLHHNNRLEVEWTAKVQRNHAVNGSKPA